MAFLRPTESKQERNANTLACLLQAMKGIRVVVELKDYSTVQGILTNCDDAMNIEMKLVTIYDLKHHSMPFRYDNFNIRGKFIRFVHFEHYFNAAKVMHQWLNVPLKLKEPRKRTR